MPEVDFYCERTTDHWFDEPFGLLSNLCFIAAGIHQMMRSGGWSLGARILVTLMFGIGIGSGLFHAFATQNTLLMDVIPINLFIISAMWILLRAHIGLGIPLVVLIIAAVLGTSALLPTNILNGSAGYLPSLLTLLVIAAIHADGSAKVALWRATVLFLFALIFRSLDNALCLHILIGTHFVWHGLNAIVLWNIVDAIRLNDDRQDVHI